MLTARELALSGCQVTLLERQQTGRESSWAGGGIISPLYPWRYDDAVTALAGWSQQHYRQLSESLKEETGEDPEWTQNGLLMMQVEDQTEAQNWAAAHRVSLQILTADDVAACEPLLGSPSPAVWMKDVAQIRNPYLAVALVASLRRLGVNVVEDMPVLSLLSRDGRVRGVKTAQGEISAGQVILAGGAWSGELMAELKTDIELQPVKGQMILFKAKPGWLQRIVLQGDRYLIPRRDGHVLMGSTLEYTQFDKSTTEVALEELQQAAFELVPGLKDYPVVKQWAGLRPGTPHGIPYILEHPGIEGLYLNAGHFRNGVVLGPASARLMADIVLKRETIIPSDSYKLLAIH
ncbi:MAG: glycine oxidase ThiO [Gammaproteobacteria bacterium]|nr:glycine oxidase ThiO [Gammaproteobacteria bacterium]